MVYPSQGVAEVIGIEKKEVHGKIQSFYVLQGPDHQTPHSHPHGQGGSGRAAADRRSDEIAEQRVILQDKEIHIDRQTWNRRYRGFMEEDQESKARAVRGRRGLSRSPTG